MHSHGHAPTPVRRANRSILRTVFAGGAIAVVALATPAFLVAFTAAPSTQAAPSLPAARAAAAQDSPGRSAIRLMKKDGATITPDDIAKFIQLTGMPRTLGPLGPITDVRAELLTSAEISVRLHGASTGFADGTLLWFVQMRGTFVFPAARGQTVTAHIGYQIFDPVTGNIVMFGGLG